MSDEHRNFLQEPAMTFDGSDFGVTDISAHPSDGEHVSTVYVKFDSPAFRSYGRRFISGNMTPSVARTLGEALVAAADEAEPPG